MLPTMRKNDDENRSSRLTSLPVPRTHSEIWHETAMVVQPPSFVQAAGSQNGVGEYIGSAPARNTLPQNMVDVGQGQPYPVMTDGLSSQATAVLDTGTVPPSKNEKQRIVQVVSTD
jgi:hypothetical protein